MLVIGSFPSSTTNASACSWPLRLSGRSGSGPSQLLRSPALACRTSSTGISSISHVERFDDRAISVVAQRVERLSAGQPADLVDLVLTGELARFRRHRPVTHEFGTSETVVVGRARQFVGHPAAQPRLLLHLSNR